MFFSPVIDLQSFYRAEDEFTLSIPSAEDTIKAAMAVIDDATNNTVRGHHLSDGSDVIEALLWVAFVL
jgi:hypothetical protein